MTFKRASACWLFVFGGHEWKLLLANNQLGMRVRSMLPGYSPHKYRLPVNIADLSAHFTKIAVSVR